LLATTNSYIFDLVEVLVVLVDLLMPEGVVMVLDLVVLAADLVVADDLLMPAGLVIVLDLVVVVVAGACEVLVVVIFDELLVVVAAGVVWAAADRLPATTNRARI
jgi:hypothetical protein